MKIFTVSETKTGMFVAGSPQYPMWTSKEPDIYVSEIEYNDDEYNKIHAEANRWRIDIDLYQDDDHGYDQQHSHSELHNRPIKDEEILVKDGSFFGIIAPVDRSFYSKSSTFHEGYEYISINTAYIKHGLWKYHNGHSSDNSSSSDDTIYYLHPLFEKE